MTFISGWSTDHAISCFGISLTALMLIPLSSSSGDPYSTTNIHILRIYSFFFFLESRENVDVYTQVMWLEIKPFLVCNGSVKDMRDRGCLGDFKARQHQCRNSMRKCYLQWRLCPFNKMDVNLKYSHSFHTIVSRKHLIL